MIDHDDGANRQTQRCTAVGVGVIFVFVVAAFYPVLFSDFVYWDDYEILVVNTRFHSLGLGALRWMATTSAYGHFQPLTWLSYSADHAIWGGRPLGYLLTNVILHFLAATFFFAVSRRLLLRAVPGAAAAHVSAASLAAALLFACHPLRAESVAWMAERRDVLSGSLLLASLFLYLRYTQVCDRSVGRRWFIASLVVFTASLAAKAVGMTFAFVLLILDWFPLQRFDDQGARRKTIVWEKLPFLAIGVIAGLRALHAQSVGGVMITAQDHGWVDRLAQAMTGIWFYLSKSILPLQLSPIYPLAPGEGFAAAWRATAALAILTAALILFRRRMRGLTAAMLILIVVSSPVLGFAQSGPQAHADRYSYMATLGLAVLGGWIVLRVASFGRRAKVAALVTVIAWVLLLTAATNAQVRIWNNSLSLWTHAVRFAPHSSIVRANLGDAFARTKLLVEAQREFEEALRISPDNDVAAAHLGDVLRLQGDPAGAISWYERSLALHPAGKLHRRLAEVLVDVGDPFKAVAWLRIGCIAHPQDHPLHDMLADMLSTYPDARIRNGQEAVSIAEAIVQTWPDEPEYLLTFATALAEAGRYADAARAARRAIVLAETHNKTHLVEELRRRLVRFERDQPFHFGD